MHIQLQPSKNLFGVKCLIFPLVALMLVLLFSRVWASEVVEASDILLSTLMLGIAGSGIILYKFETSNTDFVSRLYFERGELSYLETEKGWRYSIEHYQCHKLFHDYIEFEFVLVPDENELNDTMDEVPKYKRLQVYADMLSHLEMSYLRRICLYKNRTHLQRVFSKLQNTNG